MNSLKYKGYIGSVRFNEDDGVFSGEIEGIDGLITFEGSSIRELTDSFHKAVDDYITFCKEHGLPAKKSYSGTLNIRISPATHNSIADFAAAEGITINAFIKRALEKAVKDPASVMVPMVDGYSPSEVEPAKLEEPSVSYGSKDIAEFWIPSRDIPLAKTLAERMGWEFLVHYPESGLERALNEIQTGAVTEYSSFDEMMKEIGKEDGEV